jgi:hypothetical protein|tara:strand:+ start:76 stop:2274 length:2199 start_codon:yes stop_codon:yes gene_type:complete
MTNQTTILSFGAGVDSTALLAIELNRNVAAAALDISRQELDAKFPKVDAVVFADVGAEFPETMENVSYAKGRCEAQNLRFEIVTNQTDSLQATMARNGSIPLMPGGSHGCSLRFKSSVTKSWAEKTFAGTINWMIGIEANETARAFKSPKGDVHQAHQPLVELGLTRDRCIDLLDRLGWAIKVRKSSCFFCPFMQESEIKELHDDHPLLWAKAVAIEENFQATSPIKHQAWLDAGKPLTEIKYKSGKIGHRAPTGMWAKDSWATGARLYAKKIDGKQLSLAEWGDRFSTWSPSDPDGDTIDDIDQLIEEINDGETQESLQGEGASQVEAEAEEKQEGEVQEVLAKNVVHGLPINGTHDDKPAIEALASGSFLASYFYARPGQNKLGRQVDQAIDLVGDDGVFLLDNGAFTAFKNGTSIADDADYLDGFYDWAGSIMNRCPQALAIIPDVIDGSTERNNEMISEAIGRGLDFERMVPVWHLHEDLAQLERLVLDWNHIAIGSSGAYWKVGSAEWKARIDEMFAHLDALFADQEFSAAYVRPKLHMLRGIAVMDSYRFDSADSVNLAVNHGRQAQRNENLDAFRTRVEDKAKQGASHGDAKLGTAKDLADDIKAFEASRLEGSQELTRAEGDDMTIKINRDDWKNGQRLGLELFDPDNNPSWRRAPSNGYAELKVHGYVPQGVLELVMEEAAFEPDASKTTMMTLDFPAAVELRDLLNQFVRAHAHPAEKGDAA